MMMRDVSALDTMLISSSTNDLAITSMSMDKRRKVNEGDGGRGGRASSLSGGAKEPRMERVLIETGMLNPSPYTIRGSLLAYRDRIRERLMGYSTFIMVANLAGRNGVAVAPLLADMIKANHDEDEATACSNSNNNNKRKKARLISFVIMPFRFERDKLFKAGIALRKLSERSDCTIVIDNDSFLENNPDLSMDECYRIANGMLLEVFNIIMMGSEVDGLNILSAGIDSKVDVAVKNALSMLYSNTKPDKVRSALLYIFDGSSEGVSIGLIDALAKSISSILVGRHGEYAVVRVYSKGGMMHADDENYDDYEGMDDNNNNDDSSIGSSSISSSSDTDGTRTKAGVGDSNASDDFMHSTILLSKVTGLSKLDSYDPLSILPRECLLDWEYDESEMRLKIDSLVELPNLE
nr:hypothetical conserved protein [uncultured Candidatus Nitrosocaldus sp.]